MDSKDLETLSIQHELAEAWAELTSSLSHKAQVYILGSIQEAVEVARKEAKEGGKDVQALVTGSLHLVGGVMAVAELPL